VTEAEFERAMFWRRAFVAALHNPAVCDGCPEHAAEAAGEVADHALKEYDARWETTPNPRDESGYDPPIS